MINKICYVFSLLTFPVYAAVNGDANAHLQIIAGAESHGMVDACDCEHEPGGGVAKRATLLEKIRSTNEILLLDAGGFAAGGIYDDYTEGRKNDSLKTGQMINAMAAMKYDAAAIGDDELQYGATWLAKQASNVSLPLVSANCFNKNGKPYVAPYITVRKSGITIGITSVCTTEKLFPLDTQVIISDPVIALQKIWQELCEVSDVQIILSHTGQDKSCELAAKFPECDLIVNGHRKVDVKPLTFTGNAPVMQFGFQGKSLSGVTWSHKNDKNIFSDARWHDIVPELDNDPSISALLDNDKVLATVESSYDLYVMSQCPYGLEAIASFLEFTSMKKVPAWKIWFIGTLKNDTVFSSLHGSGEVADEKMWLALQNLYPELWHRFLTLRTTTSENTRAIMARCGADIGKIDKWVKNNGTAELEKHYNRSMRLAIDASPTLLINNRPFSKKITSLNLARFECTASPQADTLCKSLPQCSEDADCRSAGKIGTCSKQGKCEFVDDAVFKFTVVTADSTIQHPEKMAITTTQELFPAADISVLGMESNSGRQILTYSPSVLPFYLFGNEIDQTYNFSRIEGGLVKLKTGYTFKNGVVASNYYCNRKMSKDSLTLLIDPFFKGLPEILEIILTDTIYAKRIQIEPVIFLEPEAVSTGSEEFFRQEEALRWIILGKTSDLAKKKYLNAYRIHPGSSYWTECLAGTGINTDSMAHKAAESGIYLNVHWKMLDSLAIREPVILLIHNVETVAPGGAREMRRILKRIIP